MAASKLNDDSEGLPSTDAESSLPGENSEFPSRIIVQSSENILSNYGTIEANNKPDPPLGTPRHVTYWSGVCLVVGNQIGAGIFGSPAVVNGNAGSMGMSLSVWFVAGCLAWTGAASYAELGSAIPFNGGARAYLNYAFGPVFGFLFSWTAITVLKPAGHSLICLIFAEHVNRVLFRLLIPNGTSSVFANKIVSMICLWSIIIVQSIGSRWATMLNNIFTVVKVTTLIAIAVIGMNVLGRYAISSNADRIAMGRGSRNFKHNPFDGSSTEMGHYALAFYAGLWAYTGWDNLNYVVAELKHPLRDLPRVMHTATPVVIVSYLSANIGFYAVLPLDVVNNSHTIAMDFGTFIFGSIGGTIFALCVAASCFGAANSAIFTAARLIRCAGQDRYLPPTFGQLHSKRMTPVPALIFHGLLTSFYILIGNFAWLILFKGNVEWSWYLLTVLSLLVLRVREPELERVSIIIPVLFIGAAFFLLSRGVLLGLLQTLLATLFLLAGVPLYFVLSSQSIPGNWVFAKPFDNRSSRS